VVSLTSSTDRIEVGEEVTLTAVVSDDETPPDELTYQWEAPSGTIGGVGRVVKWKAPATQQVPAAYKVSLVVVDKYGSGTQALEHRVTALSPDIHVDDSFNTVQTLSKDFLRDFSNSSTTPEFCVRNFSTSCRGRQSELEDIIDNRQRFMIHSHSFAIALVNIDATRTQSTVSGPCEFRSTVKATGAIEVARGTCVLTLVYENYRWWLCSSSMRNPNTAALHFPF